MTAREIETQKMEREGKMREAEIFAYELLGQGVRIWRCFSYGKYIELPEELAVYPVTELAPYACSAHMDPGWQETLRRAGRLRFGTREGQGYEGDLSPELLPPELCGQKVEAVSLPGNLEKIGRYAFYNCDKLRRIRFQSGIRDLGAGLFTGCHHVEELDIEIAEEGPSCLRQVLAELTEELRVNYREKGEYARLLFPEFYEEGVENTPARILMTQVHGSGLHFRNCFLETRFQFSWYDERFFWARSQETAAFALELALNRLLYPLGLGKKSRELYEAYVREHFLEAGDFFLERGKKPGSPFLEEEQASRRGAGELLWLLENKAFAESLTPELLGELTEKARQKQCPEAVSYLMELGHRLFLPRVKSFEL